MINYDGSILTRTLPSLFLPDLVNCTENEQNKQGVTYNNEQEVYSNIYTVAFRGITSLAKFTQRSGSSRKAVSRLCNWLVTSLPWAEEI